MQHLRAVLRALQRERHIVIRGVEEDGDPRQSGDHLFQQLQPLRLELGSARGQSCDVPARTCQIRHYANAEGVANGAHDDGYRRGGLLRGEHGVGTPRENDVYVEADELIRQLGKSLVAPLSVAVLEANVLTLDIPEIMESSSECVDGRPGLDRQDTDRDYFPSCPLRTGGERPSNRTADQSDELATLHSITCSAPASSILGITRPRSFAVLRLITSSNFVGASTGRPAGLAPRRMRLTYSDARRNWSMACTPYDTRPPASAKYR